MALLKKYVNVLTWTYDEMHSLDLGLVAHSLNVDLGVKPVFQSARVFDANVEDQVTQKVKKLLAAGFTSPSSTPSGFPT